MNVNLLSLLDSFAHLRIVVLGEAMLDSYLEGSATRFCPEAPVPVVSLSGRRDVPGGAANTAVNVSALGGQISFISVTGDDPEAATLRRALQERGVATDCLLACPDRRTLTKQRVLAASQILVRLDQGNTDPINAEVEEAVIAHLVELFPRCDAVIVSDYGHGVVTPRVIRALADLQARFARVLVVDARRPELYRDAAPTAVKPNYQEALRLLGAGPLDGARDRADGIARHGERLLELTGAQIAAVTLDTEGAVVCERGRLPCHTHASAVRQACVAGAGDTYSATLALALAAGAPTTDAADLASAAAAVVVGKERTAVCSARELREHLSAGGKYCPDLARLAAKVEFWREQGKRIVFTNGCFDILHRGHIQYLHRAKGLGDVLIVGVNADDGIRRLKGPDRPINSLEDRIQVLAALGCVDLLIGFDEDTPCELIRHVRPDVFVKGGDYTRARLPEAPLVEELGGEVHILPYLPDRSTTGIIDRIARSTAKPSVDLAGAERR
jgi:D-beta-D-heptose 7-phosphate kinase / D-beta-D-heptose 1-phosphate adenosyltransferase